VIDYLDVAKQLGLGSVDFFPISALDGDNIVDRSLQTPWYEGPALLEFLEDVALDTNEDLVNPRFQVQYVIRPQSPELHDYRGYAGRVQSGIYKKGDEVVVLPAGISTHISNIETGGLEVEEAFAPQSVVIHLADDIDISRGDTIVKKDNIPAVSNSFEALLCWLDDKPLVKGNKYYLQHRSRTVRAVVKEIYYKLDVNTLQQQDATDTVRLNEVVRVSLKTASPLVVDPFDQLPSNAGAILIDETSNSTVAAVLIQTINA
jgi:sulfate adenylyltransferase subunit 1